MMGRGGGGGRALADGSMSGIGRRGRLRVLREKAGWLCRRRSSGGGGGVLKRLKERSPPSWWVLVALGVCWESHRIQHMPLVTTQLHVTTDCIMQQHSKGHAEELHV